MLVKDRMTKNPITVMEDIAVAEALSFMRQKNIRRLPVMNKRGRLVGIVAEKDLLYASPSPATSLSVYEIGYLLSKLKVEEIMTTDIITVSPNAPLEEAARIMVDNKVGGLPVMDGDKLVGIITETDVFKTILEMMGARDSGVRMTVSVVDEPGILSTIAGIIANNGGDIVALGTFYGESTTEGVLMLKVTGIEPKTLRRLMEEIDIAIEDLRVL